MKLTTLLTPPWCRWSDNPPKFTLSHNILYAFAGGFFSANLYYSHPILAVMARDFSTDQTGVANIPTLAQAGDAAGLLLVLPLADFFPRRRFVLALLSFTIVFWLGLCITNNLTIFQVLTFFSAVTTGVIQIFLVLVAELSPPEKRAFNISIVAAGPTFGILLARILAGIVANYTSWRNIYWLSLALQCTMYAFLWLLMPDYPATNLISARDLVKRYPKLLWSIVMLFPHHPVLVQAGILSLLTFFTVASYWTTLTFLLSESPYHYSTIAIGLFGLIGAVTMVLGPVYGKYIIQPVGVPLISAAIGKVVSLAGIVIGTFVGTHHVAGPAIQALLLDAGLMILQVSSRMEIHDCEPQARNRVNTAFTTCLYLGMLMGTKAGNEVYARHGGWLASGGLSIGVMAFSFVVILAKGPYEKGWFGWSGGWRKQTTNTVKDTESADQNSIEQEKKQEARSSIHEEAGYGITAIEVGSPESSRGAEEPATMSRKEGGLK
ncbi:hypothetical protein LTR05_004469 [Lithohypha guttulata]|uniref:Major facilitator superfamily (MFS) profile domain-containing protein n=1 Tax=Lithohypha guttulata TaxID=1690604 RepID=A0AAN7SYT1_9EURO|nr:hypothetical protein LTR05_004469 [Lithohypha guttulata]